MELLWLGITGVAGVWGYIQSRRYVKRRLRFVPAVTKPAAPIIAGVAATAVAAPVAWLLPIIGAGTALIFGASVGTGVYHGARDVRRLPGA